MFKQSLLALAVAAASLPAFAQVGVDSQTQVDVSAGVGDIGITSVMNLPSANPFSTQTVRYEGGYRVSGMPINSVASSFSSAPAWRCVKGGYGAALQAKDFGISFALPGGESDICPTEFRAAIIGGLYDRAVAAAKLPAGTQERVIANEAVEAIKAQVCVDDQIANSLEGGKLQCSDPTIAAETRKARWARERQEAAGKVAYTTMVNGQQVAVMPPSPAPRQQPQPWQAGG
ncbi:hypothetical protein D3C71_77000 [compost metagenome]